MKKSLKELKDRDYFNEDEVKCYMKLVKGEDREGPAIHFCGEEKDLVIGTSVMIDALVKECHVNAEWLILEILERVKPELKNVKIIELKDKGKNI